jgi:hypothetical protein
MMSRDRHSYYRGVQVTVRWVELEPFASGARRFVGSFSTGLEKGEQQAWHHFHESVFYTYNTAADHALQRAQQVIDASLAASLPEHSG